ncbi:uncharacterized protein TM35_000212510 [Trypanosoma theileri]|uniref:Uncharacterized protein n=1 Tax=Trypanosoma theileri TaxID=67003 RepID=A0A1X0NSG2_9TRYP|nr:uncharacterized protein TM35_000212510 [Trypanosoma theileri]ORC87645.1 hypothetical protein TM35_000212510 [Trypanosoma theileri]
MPVNEAPWLTRKMELVIMIAVFLLCFVSDFFKCKSGRMANCVGGSAMLCDRDVDSSWCTDMVLPQYAVGGGSSSEETCACSKHNNSLLLFHIVEVGAPVARTVKTKSIERVPIAPLVMYALRNKTGNVISTNMKKGLLSSDLFTPLREDIGLTPHHGSNCTPVTNKFNISYSYDTVSVPVKSNFLADMESVLPFKNDFFAIRRFLPGLYRVFEKLLSRKGSFSIDKRDPCMGIHLVMVINVLPGANASWTNVDAASIPQTLFNAQTHVRKTISRYLRKKPRYTRLLRSVWYVSMPIGYPVHADSNETVNTHAALSTTDVSKKVKKTGIGEMASVDDLISNFCPAEGEQGKVCSEKCNFYEREVLSYKVANEGLVKMTVNGGQRIGLRSILAPYNDYYHMNSTGIHTSNWRDCLYLSAEGAAVMARNIAEGLWTS